MLLDAAELADFYEGPLGLLTRRIVARQLRMLWPDTKNLRLLGYGFAVPYLRPFQIDAERAVAAMPAQQGVVAWPVGKVLTTLTDESALPFPDAFFDRVLVVHGLEGADAIRPLLRQLWRVLAPEGRMLLVAPNRTSLWAQLERSPFAVGRPFSRGELDRLLRGALFEPVAWDRALYVPPFRGRRLARAGAGWERLLRRLFPALGGVHLVEATKTIYAGTPAPVANTVPKWKTVRDAPVSLRDGASRASHDA
ncbi:MAG: methyltransferase domain-containing protein [Alphaproteobacteria bacterium]|nr:methyltransferase domain-containing protein [Alphaproteobacteria bacterium]MBL7098802.1 methyltransferase domain-containing protein [Alphaproteobacteria bacterium]